MALIDIGADASVRGDSFSGGRTIVDKNNPANASGILDTIKVYAGVNVEGLRVGTFYPINGGTLKCRDSVVIGNVQAGAVRTFTRDSGSNLLAITVQTGDYIGCYYTSGNIERDTSGFSGFWNVIGEFIDIDDIVDPGEPSYYFYEGDALSLYGTGEETAPAGQPYISRVQGVQGMRSWGGI